MNISDYINPHIIELNKSKKNVSGFIDFFYDYESLKKKKYSLAIITIPTTYNSEFFISIKKNLYLLHSHFQKPFKAIDLGEIKKGITFSDTIYATRDVCELLLQNNIIPIILTDNSYIPYSIYLAYELLNKPVTICNLDYTIFPVKKQQHYLTQILSRKNNTLFNYIILGIQNFLTPKEDINYINSKLFDYKRVGELHYNLIKTEPFLRDSDVCILNSTVLLEEYIPEFNSNNPSGINHNEICQIIRYAGLSEKLTTFCLNIIPQSTKSIFSYAQIIWHFLEGFSSRLNDYPILPARKLNKYIVEISKDLFITFYKSPISNRWWIEIPLPKNDFKKKWIVACDEQDYLDATSGIIPDKWHKSLKKVF